MLGADRTSLRNVAQRIRDFVSKRLAHLTKHGQDEVAELTYPEINLCIDEFERVAKKYIALLTGAGYSSLNPTDQFDWYSIFRFPWYQGDDPPAS